MHHFVAYQAEDQPSEPETTQRLEACPESVSRAQGLSLNREQYAVKF